MLKSSAGDNYTLNSVHDTVDKLAASRESASQHTHSRHTRCDYHFAAVLYHGLWGTKSLFRPAVRPKSVVLDDTSEQNGAGCSGSTKLCGSLLGYFFFRWGLLPTCLA